MGRDQKPGLIQKNTLAITETIRSTTTVSGGLQRVTFMRGRTKMDLDMDSE